jgi:hypothetical protein
MVTTKNQPSTKTEASALNPEEFMSAEGIPEPSSNVEVAQSPETNRDALSSEVSKREKIALLAYSYWEQRGCQGGSPEEDWFRAEREIAFASE